MEGLSPAGLVGAALGLLIGYVDYRVVGGVVEGRLRALQGAQDEAGAEAFERKIRIFRIVFAAATIGVFPVIGYLFGATVAGG